MGGSEGSILLALAAWDALVAVPHALFAACVLRATLTRGPAQAYAAGAAVAGALMLVTGGRRPTSSTSSSRSSR